MTKVGCSKEYWVNVILGSTHTNLNLETGKLVVFFRWAKCILSEWWKNISTWYLISHFYWRQNARLNQTEPSHHSSIWGERFPRDRDSPREPACTLGKSCFICCAGASAMDLLDFSLPSLPFIWTNFTTFLSKRHGASPRPASLTVQVRNISHGKDWAREPGNSGFKLT